MATITAEILVGANNATGRVDRDILAAILDARHQGWTIRDGLGSWQGTREESVTVLLSDDADAIMATMRAMVSELDQDAVAWHEVAPLRFVGRDDV
jgi:hypothetical protein